MPEFASRPATRWLDAEQQRSWRSFLLGSTLLFSRLDEDLRRDHGVAMVEYEILVRLYDADGSMRMAHLADSLAHSRSRVTHTIKRMQDAGLVTREVSPDDGRGVIAKISDKGRLLLDNVAPTHVHGVRDHFIDLATPEELAAIGRIFDAVADDLIAAHPEMEMRRRLSRGSAAGG